MIPRSSFTGRFNLMYVKGVKTMTGFVVCRSDGVAGEFICRAQLGLGCLGLKI